MFGFGVTLIYFQCHHFFQNLIWNSFLLLPLSILYRKWELVLSQLSLPCSSWWACIFPHKAYLLSFQIVCLKRGKEKVWDLPSRLVLFLCWLEWCHSFAGPFVDNTFSYVHFSLACSSEHLCSWEAMWPLGKDQSFGVRQK